MVLNIIGSVVYGNCGSDRNINKFLGSREYFLFEWLIIFSYYFIEKKYCCFWWGFYCFMEREELLFLIVRILYIGLFIVCKLDYIRK